jgi:hypothetical protein
MSDTRIIPGSTDERLADHTAAIPAGPSAPSGPSTSSGPAVSSGRDLTMTALVLGVAGLAWFGWGQSGLAEGWAAFLQAGSVAALAVVVAAGVLLRRLPGGLSAMDDVRLRRGYWKVVAAEVIVIVAGSAALSAGGRPAYVPAWTLLVVGVHFLPLARMFGTPGLSAAGLVLAVAAGGAAAAGAVAGVRPSLVAGVAGGVVCVACAAACLRSAARRGRAPEASGALEPGSALEPGGTPDPGGAPAGPR